MYIFGEMDDTGAPTTVTEVVVFRAEVNDSVHLVIDTEEKRSGAAYFESEPQKPFIVEYDSEGALGDIAEVNEMVLRRSRRLARSLDGTFYLRRGHPTGRRLSETCIANCELFLGMLQEVVQVIYAQNFYVSGRFTGYVIDYALMFAIHIAERTQATAACQTFCQTSGGVGDPHIVGLLGQHFDITGVDGGWYCMMSDKDIDLHVNARFTNPPIGRSSLRQYITGVAVLTNSHSLVIEVRNPYDVNTDGCPVMNSPCILDGGLRILADGEEVDWILSSTRSEQIVNSIELSAANLPVECRNFGGQKIWPRMYKEMPRGERQLRTETFEDWVLKYEDTTAHEWCTKYISERGLDNLQSMHAILRIATPSAVVRVNAGTKQLWGNRKVDGDDTSATDTEFWRMDVRFEDLSLGHPDKMNGIVGGTARPVFDAKGDLGLKGSDAFRGTAEDYRVPHALGTDFYLLETKGSLL